MDALHAPVALANFCREVVEQFRMRDGAAHDAEVAGGEAEASAEMPLPEPVSDDAGGEGVFGVYEPSGEIGAGQCGVRSARCGIGDARDGRWDRESRAAVISADPKAGGESVFLIREDADRHIAFERGYRRLENCAEAIEIGLAEWVVLVVVALSAAKLQSEEHRADGGSHFVHQAVTALDLVVDVGHVWAGQTIHGGDLAR